MPESVCLGLCVNKRIAWESTSGQCLARVYRMCMSRGHCQFQMLMWLQVNKMEPCTIPEDRRFRNKSVLHYTYGQDYDVDGRSTYGKIGPWHWDKRDYAGSYPTLPITEPPPGSPETIVQLVERIGRAGMSLEYWPWWKANMAPRGAS